MYNVQGLLCKVSSKIDIDGEGGGVKKIYSNEHNPLGKAYMKVIEVNMVL